MRALQFNSKYSRANLLENIDHFVIWQVFIVVMTAKCVQEQVIRDHVALAYISNSIIIPVGREYYPDVSKHMDSAM